eukprot:539166-Amphidinium_carterae.1
MQAFATLPNDTKVRVAFLADLAPALLLPPVDDRGFDENLWADNDDTPAEDYVVVGKVGKGWNKGP